MTIWININYLIGNFLIFVIYVCLKIFGGRTNPFFAITLQLANLLMWSTLGFNILIYNYFNKKFHNTLVSTINVRFMIRYVY